MSVPTIRVGDTHYAFSVTFLDDSNAAADISTATLTMRMRLQGASGQAGAGTFSVVSGPAGTATYQLAAGDVAAPGLAIFQATATFPGSDPLTSDEWELEIRPKV